MHMDALQSQVEALYLHLPPPPGRLALTLENLWAAVKLQDTAPELEIEDACTSFFAQKLLEI